MNADTLALARAIGKLPGAPTWKYDSVNVVIDYDRSDGSTGRRSANGLGWVRDPDDGRYVLDLDDAATGGAMLAHLGPGWLLYQRDHDHQWEIARPDGADKQEGPTLGIALARLIIARGGWNA